MTFSFSSTILKFPPHYPSPLLILLILNLITCSFTILPTSQLVLSVCHRICIVCVSYSSGSRPQSQLIFPLLQKPLRHGLEMGGALGGRYPPGQFYGCFEPGNDEYSQLYLFDYSLVAKLFCRYIGRPHIALARQDKIYRNISDALGRLRLDHEYLSIYPNTNT